MDKCPLTGKPCSKIKNIYVTEVNQEYKACGEMRLCQECGTEMVRPDPTPTNSILADLVSQFIAAAVMQLKQPPKPPEQPPASKCPTCGWTITDIAYHGRLGCQDCYNFYKADLIPALNACHGQTIKHVGKVPKAWEKRQEEEKTAALESTAQEELKKSLEERITSLEDQMIGLAKSEDYEGAAALRDAIKILKQELPS